MSNFLNFSLITTILILVFLAIIILYFFYIQGWNLNDESNKHLVQVVTLETMDTMTKELTDLPTGFCETHRGKSDELDKDCNELTQGNCNVTDCCVWVNKTKCSAGGVNGPTYKTDKDGNLITVDSYYYKNKCYGGSCQ